MTQPIYLDYNATTPIHATVAEAMQPTLTALFGNPSSGHAFGLAARDAVETGRAQLASLLGCTPGEIIFTGGGTEANNLAIMGLARARQGQGRHLITSVVEHPAVNEPLGQLEREGFTVSRLPVDGEGRLDPQSVADAIGPDTILITVMHANNEVGTVMPLAAIGDLARDRGIAFHSDAAQSVGKIPTRVSELGVDLLSVAGHKLYAPKGVGALYLREGLALERVVFGADHESGRRPGTENIPGIVGLGRAAALAADGLEAHGVHLAKLRDGLQSAIEAGLPPGCTRLNGHPDARLPNTLNLSFRGLEAHRLLAALPGIAASAGAACHSGDEDKSGVLAAMGVPAEFLPGALRLSTGRGLTDEDVAQAAQEIVAAARQLGVA